VIAVLAKLDVCENEADVVNEELIEFITYEAVAACVAKLAVPISEPETFPLILPVTTTLPEISIDPVNSNVSALPENNILPLSPVALKPPDTDREPEIITG